ncbi:SDR family oxidoreductase [Nocardia brasiliensis]|uniref:SDR family oxidoreductase n=1 Tax=Nocardia brasiliensis TaxID=37326 RepID=UPI00366FC0F7
MVELGLNGRTAVVCASTSGLGRAIAEALSDEGANVVVCGRRGSVADNIASGLPRAVGFGVDLLAPASGQRLLAAAQKAFGPADIVVLNGPGPGPGRVTEIQEQELDQAVGSLVTAHHRLVTLALPHMREQGWGRVLAVGSSAVLTPIPDLALSGIGRAALAAYLKALATEVAADGVTINMLLPGRIVTERVQQIDAARAAQSGRTLSAEQAESVARIPMNRYGRPAELAAIAAFLCSDLASYITGTLVRCDGGLSPVV